MSAPLPRSVAKPLVLTMGLGSLLGASFVVAGHSDDHTEHTAPNILGEAQAGKDLQLPEPLFAVSAGVLKADICKIGGLLPIPDYSDPTASGIGKIRATGHGRAVVRTAPTLPPGATQSLTNKALAKGFINTGNISVFRDNSRTDQAKSTQQVLLKADAPDMSGGLSQTVEPDPAHRTGASTLVDGTFSAPRPPTRTGDLQTANAMPEVDFGRAQGIQPGLDVAEPRGDFVQNAESALTAHTAPEATGRIVGNSISSDALAGGEVGQPAIQLVPPEDIVGAMRTRAVIDIRADAVAPGRATDHAAVLSKADMADVRSARDHASRSRSISKVQVRAAQTAIPTALDRDNLSGGQARYGQRAEALGHSALQQSGSQHTTSSPAVVLDQAKQVETLPARLSNPGTAAPGLPAAMLRQGAAGLPQPAFGMVDGNGAARMSSDARLTDVRGAAGAAPFTLDDELILELRTGQGEMAQTITAYGNRAETYLPLGEITRLLDLAIVVSDDGRYASGWVLDDQQVVALNLRAGTMVIAGREIALKAADAQAVDGELYLRSGLFAQLMPLELKVDLRAQTVTVQTRQPFPFEQRAAREAAREQLAGRGKGRQAAAYEPEATPYRVLDVPMGEVELRAVSDVARGRRTEADVRLAGDLAYLTGQLYVTASSRDGVTAARATLGRRDPDGRLLGPLRASVFEIGDVASDALPLGLRGIAGRGMTLSNTALERASVFDRIDLRGELPDGWEAELYRNNTLIGSSATAVNGRYEFLQIPLEFGLNVMRVVLYGPQGQRREAVQRLNVGDGRLAAGELRYSLSAAQRDTNLLGLTGPDFVPGVDFGRWRATGQLAYGVNAAVTASLGAGWYQSDSGTHWLATAGLRGGLGSIAGQVNVGTNDDGGLALDARLAGRTLGIAWTAVHGEYKGRFTDELRAFSIEPLRRASEADMTATLRLGTGERALAVPLAGRLRRIEFADRRVQIDASLRASTVVRRLLLSNTVTLTRSQVPGFDGDTQILGSFDLATLNSGRTRYRAALGYRLSPGRQLSRAAVEVDRTFGPDTMVKASAGRVFDTKETVLGASAVHRLGPVALALDANLTLPRKDHAIMARIGFSFGRNPVSNAFFVAQPGLTAGGAVAVAAFADGNGNGIRDGDDALIEGAEIDTGAQVVRTGTDGVAFLGQLGNATRTYVRLNAESLPDIAMAPSRPGFSITPRPGRIHVSKFPIDMLGEVEGSAVFGSEQRGVSGLALVLIDSAGHQAARVRTGAGGTFLMEQVRPGQYRLDIDQEQAKRLGLAVSQDTFVVIDAAHPIVRLKVLVGKRDDN